MSKVTLRDVRKTYHHDEVIHGVNLDIREGEFMVFVGPSGCGKSTLLRMIAGLEAITDGTISIGDRVVNQVIAAERGVAMVFQSYALYPHMSVYDNMAFGLRQAKTPKDEVDRRVREGAATLQISEYLDRLPKHLSGGQRQRVAIGRAIVRNPRVFLFDEPLSNLDAALRGQTRLEIARLHAQLDATMIYVTHDQVEAMTLADRIAVVNDGRIEQVGTPMELYHQPKNAFVAEFIGSPKINLLSATASSSASNALALGSGHTLTLERDVAPSVASLGIRPEHVEVREESASTMAGDITHLERFGGYTLLYLRLAGSTETASTMDEAALGNSVVAKFDGDQSVSIGERVHVAFSAKNIHLFDRSGSALA